MFRTRCRLSKYIPERRWLAEWWMVGGTNGIVVQWIGAYALNNVCKKNTCVYIQKNICKPISSSSITWFALSLLITPAVCLFLMVCEPFLVGSLLPKDGVMCCTEWPRDFAVTSSCGSHQMYKTDISEQTVWSDTSYFAWRSMQG